MDDKKIENIIEKELSGFFTRGKLSEHDAKIVKKWIDKFVKLHEKEEKKDAGG